MMWNWLFSSLAVGATVFLYDGNPTYPDDSVIWELIQDEKVTILGTSASYTTRHTLTGELKSKIKKTLRENASPRHVPAKIIEVPDIPYTLNMKKVEIAVSNLVNGRPVLNRDALANPESLDYYEGIIRDLQNE